MPETTRSGRRSPQSTSSAWRTTEAGLPAQAKARTDALRDSIEGLPKSAQTKVESEFDKGGIDAAYAALRKIDKKKADAFIRSILDRGGINEWGRYNPPTKTAYVDTVHRTKSGTAFKASGGSVFGPGTETSDSIPAMLSNGEYVIRAASAAKLGMSRLDWLNRFGELPRFATGGQVASAPIHYAPNYSAPPASSSVAPSVGHLAGDSKPLAALLLASSGDSISTCAVVSGVRLMPRPRYAAVVVWPAREAAASVSPHA